MGRGSGGERARGGPILCCPLPVGDSGLAVCPALPLGPVSPGLLSCRHRLVHHKAPPPLLSQRGRGRCGGARPPRASPRPGRRGLQREALLASGPRSSLSGARGGVREAESLPRALWGPWTAGAAWPTRTRLRRRPAPVLLGAVASLPALLGLNVRVTSLAHGFSEFSLPGCFQQTLTERLMPQALC